MPADRRILGVSEADWHVPVQRPLSYPRRLTWVAAGILLWAGLIFAKLFSLEVVHHQEYVRLARQQQQMKVEIPAPRGPIFDRTGQPLAMSIPAESVYVNPLRVPDLGVASSILARILQLDPADLHQRMRWAFAHQRGFLWVKRKISSAEGDELRSLHLEWIEFQSESQRHYPNGRLAAHVLGSVDHDEKGNAGIEMALDAALRGHAGEELMLTDVKRRGIDAQLSTQPHAGTPLTLTIDSRIQFTAEQELVKGVEEHHARTGSIIVMNPYNGEILALANYPAFDPNEPPKPGDNPAARFDLAVSVPFEPGSVFKVVTLSAALETTDLTPSSPINCHNGVLRLPGRVVHEAHNGFGVIPMHEVLERSSNIGAIQIGMRVGAQNMYAYMRRFGFGSAAGLRLPAESSGMLRRLDRWGKTSLASVSMGHEVGTTSIQLARACAVIANGGLLVKPKLILKNGDQLTATEPPKRILRPETAITMRQMMEGVVISPHGTAHRNARLVGYTSGGKTGTAQIFDAKTHRYTHQYNSSFMGFAPVTNPALIIVVTINGTTGNSGMGGAAAAPVFKAVATEALRVLDVPKDLPDAGPEPETPHATETDDLAIADLDPSMPNIMEDAAAQQDPGTPGPEENGPKVPNFRGKTMRAVVEEAAAMGLPVLLDGSGVARGQLPQPGSVLHPGERVRVQFAR
ncbi:MAG TPA: penicillin-binding protein [Bryobacteraceae bacterium]|nr:penicillin-binding protein [Bryobacteraceae bacterium]